MMRVRTNRAVTTRAGIKENAPGLPISPERPPPELLPNPVLTTNHGKGAPISAKKQPPAITAPIVLLVPVIVELLLTQLCGLPVRQAGNRFIYRAGCDYAFLPRSSPDFSTNSVPDR